MTPQERTLVMEQLVSSEARLLALVEGLSRPQLDFRESAERWSIAENLEHLVLFEEFIRGTILKAVQGPVEAEKKALAAGKEPLVLGLAEARRVKFNAREVVRPTGRWPDAAAPVAELRATRARTLAFAAETECELRDYFFPHIAFGDLDCYQWLVLLGQHTMRHVLQIREIMADAKYPAL